MPELKPADQPDPTTDRRAFGDSAATSKSIYRLSLDAASKLPAIPAGLGTITFEKPDYADPDAFSKKDLAHARMAGTTPARRLRVDAVMRDADGQEVDRKRTTLATIPHYDSGRFVLGGTEYTLASQLRLRPGVYVRRKASGDVEAHVNVLPGQGRGARIGFDPTDAKLSLRVRQAEYPLASILKETGVSEKAMRDAWGDAVFEAAGPHRPHAAVKLGKSLGVPDDSTDPGGDLRKIISAYPLDPRVNLATLGKPHVGMTPEALLDAAAKVIKVHAGELEPDDRDSLAYMKAYAPEHLISERIERGLPILNMAARVAARDGSLRRWPTGILSKHVRDAVTLSGLGTVADGTNPAQILDQENRVSRMGVGGMPGAESIPEESRAVQPSHLGYVDFVATPESDRAGVEARAVRGLSRDDAGELYAPFKNARTGAREVVSARDMGGRLLELPGQTGEFRASVGKGGTTVGRARDNSYVVSHMEDAFSPLMNLIPLKSGVKPQRALMGARMVSQALPLEGAEAPLVQSEAPDSGGRSFHDVYADKFGALRSPKGGTVTAVAPDRVDLTHDDGSTASHELRFHEPSNSKTGFHQTATVAPGQPTRSSGPCSPRSPSATLTCPITWSTSPISPSGRPVSWIALRGWWRRCGSPPSCMTSARWRFPRRSSPSLGR